jgi:oligopeptide/dipeptide ABC transporter ATP-binding protein
VSNSPDGVPLLEVRNLITCFETTAGPLRAVDGISFAIQPGQRMAIVGESGSGKSATALSLLRLIDPPGTVAADAISFRGRDLLTLSAAEMRQVRGRDIALVLQDPFASLNPVFSVGEQIAETMHYHEQISRGAARERSIDLLGQVGIPHPRARIDEYPHRFSGGMRQRVAIAIALACNPALLIADEPTTALDVTVQAQVLEVLVRLSQERGMAVLLITHNLGVVAGFAERLAVMYAGRIVESGDVEALYYRSCNPYTRALLAAQPRADQDRGARLVAIPGAPPNPLHRPSGCAFHPRCPHRQGRARCVEDDPVLRQAEVVGHLSACHFLEEVMAMPLATSMEAR